MKGETKMNLVRRIVMGLGSLVAVALVLALAAPKTVHALVSALVTVSNTAANPVPTIGAEAGRAFVVGNSCLFTGATSCFVIPVYTVPAGETAVIESGSYTCSLNAGTALTLATMSFTAPGGNLASVHFSPVSSGSQNIKTYAGPGDIDASFDASGSQASGCIFTVSGYLVP